MTTSSDVRVPRRIPYAGSVHDDAEIAAALEVLRGDPTAMRIGRNIRMFEERVAGLFGKRYGVMCNSGSGRPRCTWRSSCSVSSRATRSSRPRWCSRPSGADRPRGSRPLFVDVEPDTYNVDAGVIEEAIGPRTRAILLPDLIGNAPV